MTAGAILHGTALPAPLRHQLLAAIRRVSHVTGVRAGLLSTAGTYHPPKWKLPTTLRIQPSNLLSCQTNKSPDSPGRFNNSDCCNDPKLRADSRPH